MRHRRTGLTSARRIAAGVVVCAGLTGAAMSGWAFGTIRSLGQDAEHERITRHAFACNDKAASDDCFQKKTLEMLAGSKNSFGAVGLPDRGPLIFKAEAHCDAADWFDVTGYPQAKADARAHLEACRTWMKKELDAAVEAAGDLLDAQGKARDSELPTIVACNFVAPAKGRAKCNVLEHLGILLHAAQDFYSHSNWTDAPDRAQPVSPANPPGLDQRGRAPWLDLRTDGRFPNGLITGCFEAKSAISEEANCNYGSGKTPRVKHLALNKDEGQIDPAIGDGKTMRGRVNRNFRHAVEAAIEDSRDKWATLREQLVLTYGPSRGTRMICLLTRDKGRKAC
jgi:hypothetical protein